MEITLDQALRKGVEAHKSGRVQEADRYYTAILKTKPKHPDANHNMGVLAVDIGKVEEALPFFKTALEVNPSIAQFWLSYIDTLVKLNRLDEAKTVCDEARNKGLNGVGFDQIERINQNYFKGSDLMTTENNKMQLKPDIQEPPDNELKPLVELYIRGQFKDFLEQSSPFLKKYPNSSILYNARGAAYAELTLWTKAIKSYKSAISIKPDYAEAFSNMGNVLRSQGKFQEAIAAYNNAITIKPDFAEAFYNKGNIFHDLRNFERAIDSYQEAITLKLDYGKALHNLGLTLTFFEATSYSKKLEKCYLTVLGHGTCVRPDFLSNSIIKFLRKHNTIKRALVRKQKAEFTKTAYELCIKLSKIPLLLKILEICPLADLDLEDLLKQLRKTLLLEEDKFSEKHKLIHFQVSLAMHCFTNEFIFGETEAETFAIKKLEVEIYEAVTDKKSISPFKIACLGSYRPLNSYPWSNSLQPSNELDRLYKQQIVEVNNERVLSKKIPTLKKVKRVVSVRVQKQYEENPYPRWVNTALELTPLSIAELIQKLEFQLVNECHFPENPTILIAGCGTGQQSLGAASRIKNSHVTAIDLSIKSLSYAKRKTLEYRFKNIDYIQADILDLKHLKKKFDIIECVGVLHHMKDPILGWRTLETCLKPGGLMKIGLYSEEARKHIVKARDTISNLEIGNSYQEILSFREFIKNSNDKTLLALTREVDFYSTSTFRDLVFHVQEHRFTAPELYQAIKLLNLNFIGFEYPNSEEKKRNRPLCPKWMCGPNLPFSNELDFPQQPFWLQKSLNIEG